MYFLNKNQKCIFS